MLVTGGAESRCVDRCLADRDHRAGCDGGHGSGSRADRGAGQGLGHRWPSREDGRAQVSKGPPDYLTSSNVIGRSVDDCYLVVSLIRSCKVISHKSCRKLCY